MKPFLYFLLASLITFTSCDPFGSLLVEPNTYEIQEQTDYVFTLQLISDQMENQTIPSGSQIVVYFPDEYPLLPQQSHTCAIISWPTSYSSITCTLTYRTLTISNAFSTSFVILTTAPTLNFKWIVNNIDNPLISQKTGYFNGQIQHSSTSVFSQSYIGLGLTMIPGILVAQMSVSPSSTDSTANLTITITPKHSIPVGGYLRMSFASAWSTAIYTVYILSSSSACLGVNNTAVNLGCTSEPPFPDYIVSVTNIYTSQSNAPFSFNLTQFRNPPTTQPLAIFSFQTYNSTDASTGAVIDQSLNNFLSGVTPAPIQNPRFYLSSYQLGTAVQADFTVTIVNVIARTDIFYIEAPTEIDLSTVTSVLVASVAIQTGTLAIISKNMISFSSQIELSNPNPINITLRNITLPGYAATISTPFSIYIKRNSFLICSLSQAFSLELTSGSINVTLSPSSSIAGMPSSYNFSLSFQHAISSTSKLAFSFSSSYFSIGSGITCQSSRSTTCTVTNTSGNIVEVTSLTVSSVNTLDVVLVGVTNPSSVGKFPAVAVYSYIYLNGNYYIVDVNADSAYFSLDPRPMLIADLNISASSTRVFSSSTMTFSIRNNNQVPAGAYIILQIPQAITYTSIRCNFVCVPGTFNGKRGIQLQNVGPIAAGTISTYTVQNMVNPISTKPTSPFAIDIYDSTNQLLQYLTSGVTFSADSPSVLTMSISATSSTNSEICQYLLTCSTNYQISEAVALILVLPNSQSCPACTSTAFNSTHNEVIFYGQVMVNNSIMLTLTNITNFFSLQPQTINGAVMSQNLLYFYANGSTTVTTTAPSTPSLSYQFTTYQLAASTALIITNIISATLQSRVAQLKLLFGTDFNLSNAVCTSTGYSCIVSTSEISFTVLSVGSLPAITITNIIAPSLSPSTTITLSTYSSSGYLIDRGSSMRWATNCQFPCRSCAASNASVCLSCYSDQFLAQGKVLYFGGNSSCVSECGDKYYKNYTRNTCELCSTDCQNCLNFTQCTSCPANKYLLLSEATCYTVCPIGYYIHATQCLPCSTTLHCYTCLNELTCASCSGSYFYYQLQCLPSCPENTTTLNTTTNTCDYCPTNCSTCSLSSSNNVVCIACVSGFLDAGRCVQICESVGTVPDGFICSGCDPNCLTCSGSTIFCLTCNSTSNYPYILSNRCYANCPATYYDDNNTFSCLPCTKPCETCTGYSSNACSSCISSYSLIGTICRSNCPQQYYSNGTSCLPCEGACLTCQSSALCFTCLTNYSLISANSSCVLECPQGMVAVSQVCQLCSSNCKACSTVTICSSCPSFTYLLNGSCISPCLVGYYANATLGVCQDCHYSCTRCTNYSYCTSCSSGYQLQIDFTCTSLCPTNQVPISGICLNCSTGCSQCQQTTTNCTACSPSYFYSPSQNRCYVQCPSSLYLSTAEECVTSCGSDQYTTIDNATNVSQCIQCPAFCASCISSEVCGTCLSGAYKYAGLCHSSCPAPAIYPIGANCQTCNVVDCQTCLGTECSVCASGKYLIGTSLCISSCGSSQVYNPTNKTCDTIGTTTGPGGGSSTTINTTTSTSLSFIPMPYFIVFCIIAIFVLILHYRDKLSAIPTLFGLVGGILKLSTFTLILVAFLSGDNSATLVKIGIYFLVGGEIIIVLTSAVSIALWYRHLRQKTGVAVASIAHFSILALLTSNFSGYNSYFLEEHRKFWRKYKLLCKIGLLLLLPHLIGSVLISLGVADKYSYNYFGGIQVCLLSLTVLILQILWLWVPLKEPPVQTQEVISDKSTENFQGTSQIQKQTEYSSYKQGSNGFKIRVSDIKTEGDKILQQSRQLPKVRSNFQFNQVHEVIKLDPASIPEAIEQGLFRSSEQELKKNIKDREQMSNLDSAPKLNKYMQMSLQNNEKQSLAPPEPKQTDLSNIFEQEDDYLQEDKQLEPSIQFHSPKNFAGSDLDSGQNALFDEPIHTKEEDFRYNIIFQEPEEDNLTFPEQQSEPHLQPTIRKDSSLGTIMADPEEVKVQSKEKSTERLYSPIFASKMTPNPISIEDFDDSFTQPRIDLFQGKANRSKPMTSKQLKLKAKEIKEHQPKKEEYLSKEIIHADLEQILTVEADDLDYFEEDIVYHDSGRRLADIKEKHTIVDLDKPVHSFGGFREEERPGSLLARAAVNYQLGIQKNMPPPEKKQRGRLPNRK